MCGIAGLVSLDGTGPDLGLLNRMSEAAALSDRILVMSERPGTIVHEIVVDLPDRHNPMQRRKLPRLSQLVSELMTLLKLDAQSEVH